MDNQTNNTSIQNIVIQNVTDSTITLNVNGEKQEIGNNLSELKAFLEKHGKSLQIGEKIYNIGEIGQAQFTTIINQYQQEAKRSFYLRIFLFVIVPVLAIGFAYLFYRNQILKQPLQLTVDFENLTPNEELPAVSAVLTLTYGDKIETKKNVTGEVIFKGIPSNFRKRTVQLSFEAEGFTHKDTSFIITPQVLKLPILRDSSLAKITGVIDDVNNNPLEGVKVTVLDINAYTDKSGNFVLYIPFNKQRTKQRITTFFEGFEKKDVETPVIPNEKVRLNLEKIKTTGK